MKTTGLILAALLWAACDRVDGWAAEVAHKQSQADALLDGGDAAAARRLLASIIEGAPTGGDREIRRVLLADTHFRLARLALAAGDSGEALRQADAGLALGDRSDLFSANLLVARGAAQEARGEARAALDDYERALRMNELLLRETLGDHP